MTLKLLKERVESIIADLKDNGTFPKENDTLDYKLKLNIEQDSDPLITFLKNFAKDIIAFSNGEGGIILLGFKEENSAIIDTGLDESNLVILNSIDLNLLYQKFEKILKMGVKIDLQKFRVSSRQFYYILIEKSTSTLIPQNNFPEYKINRGDILYRTSGKNEIANHSTNDFNRFLQLKSNEKNKEFMEIWSKLLPEMFDINPKEILILNPKDNRVYGYNAKDKVLTGSEIDIDQSENGIFNIILNAISAGDIGKISNDEGKPIYKIIGEIKSKVPRHFIYLSSLHQQVKEQSHYNISTTQLKQVLKYTNWIFDENIPIQNPDLKLINTEYDEYLWIEYLDKTHKIVFSSSAIIPLVALINDPSNHQEIFGKNLLPKK